MKKLWAQELLEGADLVGIDEGAHGNYEHLGSERAEEKNLCVFDDRSEIAPIVVKEEGASGGLDACGIEREVAFRNDGSVDVGGPEDQQVA